MIPSENKRERKGISPPKNEGVLEVPHIRRGGWKGCGRGFEEAPPFCRRATTNIQSPGRVGTPSRRTAPCKNTGKGRKLSRRANKKN